MKSIEVIADAGHTDTITGIAEQGGIRDYWLGPPDEDGRRPVRILASDAQRQAVLDALQAALGSSENARIVVMPVEVVLPKAPAADQDREDRRTALTREELYNSVEKNARLNSTFLLLVALSTLVAGIGLLENNVAVVVGAMVIAPLLGPNIALALGAALGDRVLMWQAFQSLAAGLMLATLLSLGIGALWPFSFDSPELVTRTDVGLDSMALALASGAAAVLSLTTGLPSVLVGVMVAVALLPPTAAMGIMLGAGKLGLAGGAALLLAVNIVSVNLAAKLAFLARGVKPRTWLEQRKARQSTWIYIAIWILSLAVLILAIYLRGKLFVTAH